MPQAAVASAEQEAPPIIKKNLNRPRVLKISAQKGKTTAATTTTNGKCFNDDDNRVAYVAAIAASCSLSRRLVVVATLRAARQLPNGSWSAATFYATHNNNM